MEGRPLKFGSAKKTSKIQRHFWQLSTLIANISGMTPDIQNLKEMWSTAIPPAFHEKSPVNFGPQTKKFYWLTLSHPSEFLEDYISAPRGCCAMKFIYALEIAQALIAHTRSGTGVPPKNFNRENLKFGLTFSVLATITSGLVGVSTQNIFHTTCHEAGVITLVQLLEGRPPKIWEGERTSKIKRDFDNFRLWSRISPEWLQIFKIWKKRDRQRFLPRCRKKVRWTLVHKQKSFIG